MRMLCQYTVMSKCVKDNIQLLRALARMSPKRAQVFLKSADKDLVQSLCECALNILNGNVPLRACQHRDLYRHRHVLRRLIDGDRRWRVKRRVLAQRGGSLMGSLLLPILATVLSNVTL